MASLTEIFNRALVLLGEKRISAPSDDTKAARELSAVWDTSRKGLLRSHAWGFAMKRAALAPLATTPAFGFTNQFPLPSDFLRLYRVADFFVGLPTWGLYVGGEEPYAIEDSTSGTVLMCDLGNPLNIVYISDVTVTTKFDALFVPALAAQLALDTASTLAGSDAASVRAERALARALAAARAANAIERPPQQLSDGAWLASRV